MAVSLTMIPRTTGTVINGTFTGYTPDGLTGTASQAFDGNNSKAWNATATAWSSALTNTVASYTWLAKDLGTPTIIGAAKTYNSTNLCYDYTFRNIPPGPFFYLFLWGSNSNPTSGPSTTGAMILGMTELKSDPMSQNVLTVYSADIVNPYRYVGIAFSHYAARTGAPNVQIFGLSQVEFYTTP